MIRFFTAFTLLVLLFSNSYSSERFIGSQASAKINGATELWYKSSATHPSYIRFADDFNLSSTEVLSWIKEEFTIPSNVDFSIEKTFETKDGIQHVVYNSVYNEVHIEFLRFTVHLDGDRVLSISGKFPNNYNPINSINLNESQALDMALEVVNAKTYKWEVPAEERWLKLQRNNPQATFYPEIEMVLIDGDLNYTKSELHYAYKMNVYAHEPMSSQDIYIDAGDGHLIFRHNSIHGADSTGLAHTGFSGLREIKSSLSGILFRLEEKDRGNGIVTLDLNNTVVLGAAVPFEDEDNVWKYTTGDLDAFATDAHWAAEVTYDYLMAHFQRNSLDDSGFAITNYVHYGEAFNGARWDDQLQVFLYGDGVNHLTPFTTIDIVGHEIGHGLTSFTADLIYQDESGALNESFSDILGNCVEYYGKPEDASWRIGEDRGSFMRDMSFPNAKDHPDTYEGTDWYEGPLDNGGVHTNSGVQNFWFYLLSEGGNGINDLGSSFDVDGIGIMNAALIAYRALNVYLDPTSDFEDMSYFSTLAAVDIFGNCSAQHESTAKAWQAVGLENNFNNTTTADFIADKVDYCNVPFTIQFVNNSVNGQSYFWDFGDGTTSSDLNPVHTYNSVGNFDVKLTVDGSGCGVDEILKDDLVMVYGIEAPSAQNADIFKGDSVSLNATSVSGDIYWYSDKEGLNVVGKGNVFQTPALEENTTYYLNSISTGELHYLGPDIEKHLSKGQFSNTSVGVEFEAYQSLVLASVKVKAQEKGERTIFIKDSQSGNVIFQKIVTIDEGVQIVEINATLEAGKYEMYHSGNNSGLWIGNKSEYPYGHSGLMSITGNTSEIDNTLPYFFDWSVLEKDCESDMVEVTVSVEDIKSIKKPVYNFYVNGNGEFKYFADFFFKENTLLQFRLFGINGQLMDEIDREMFKGLNTVDINQLFNLENHPSGVFFISISGGGLEKTEKIVNKGGLD